jgi:hypothetical protein
MNSIINGSRLMVVALCGLVVMGCDSIKDVRSSPSTAPPPDAVLLGGTITGLGTRRAMYLDSGIELAGHQKERAFFGSLLSATIPFSYGSIPAGTPYNFTVLNQPFGKICSIDNASGVAGDGGPAPAVTCEEDPSVTRFTISGTVNPTVASLPGATVILETEDGIERIPLNGSTTFTFQQRIFTQPAVAGAAAPPAFNWTVLATFTEDGRDYNCRVSPNSGTNPTANVANVQVQACSFPIEASVMYSAPPGGTDQPMGNGGVTLALRRIGDAVPDAAPVTITSFTAANTRTVLWPALRSYPGAAFDLVVTDQPEGQTCIARVLNGTASIGSLIWLDRPALPAFFTPNLVGVGAGGVVTNTNLNGVSIRCRNNPAPEKQLRGVFRNIIRTTSTNEPLIRITNRQFMSFFDDGTFIFGTHGTATAQSGLEHGFYNYDPVARTLDFNVFLDASTQANLSVVPPSLSNTLGYIPSTGAPTAAGPGSAGAALANGSIARATNVITSTVSPASIEMTFTGVPTPATGATAGPSTTTTLTFTEPTQIPGQMTGAWVSADNRRFWVFDFDNTTGFHAGLNGPINVQDGCFVFDDAAAPSGYYTRRGGSTGCMTLSGSATTGGGGVRFIENYQTGFASIDFFAPSGNLTSAPPGFFGRFPGAQGAGDGRPPSPTLFEVISGTPDTLIAQRTVNGTPIEIQHEFTRVIPKLD